MISPVGSVIEQCSADLIMTAATPYSRMELTIVDFMNEHGAGVYVVMMIVAPERFADKEGRVPCVVYPMSLESARQMHSHLSEILTRIDSGPDDGDGDK